MNKEPVPETPFEADRRKIAGLDFAPTCEIDDCAQRASRAVQCTHCNAIVAWFCYPHAQALDYMPDKETQCGECGHHDEMHQLAAVVSLAGWF